MYAISKHLFPDLYPDVHLLTQHFDNMKKNNTYSFLFLKNNNYHSCRQPQLHNGPKKSNAAGKLWFFLKKNKRINLNTQKNSWLLSRNWVGLLLLLKFDIRLKQRQLLTSANAGAHLHRLRTSGIPTTSANSCRRTGILLKLESVFESEKLILQTT